MVDSCNDRPVGWLSRVAIYDVMLAQQSAAVSNHVTGVGDIDGHRVWSVPGGALLCCCQSAVNDDDVVGPTCFTGPHHYAGGRRTAVEHLRQSANHVVQLGLWR